MQNGHIIDPLIVLLMNYFLFSWIKSYAKLLIYSRIQKPDYRQFTPTNFVASMKPFAFKGVTYKRWHMIAVYWFQNMNFYDAIKGKPEADLTPAQEEAFG